MINKVEYIQVGKKKIVSKQIHFCGYCNYPSKDLIVCSGHNCDVRLCSGCRTYVNNLPFCNECLAEIIKNKTFMVITKGELPIKKVNIDESDEEE